VKEPYVAIVRGWLCARCQATNRRGTQCGKPAMKGKSKCRNHGGRSTGPKTPEGIERIRAALWKHGHRSLEGRKKETETRVKVRLLADSLRVLGDIEGPQIRGKWPEGYEPITDLAGIEALVRRENS